jgi:hypothetical protein
MTNLAMAFRNAVLNISAKEGQPATLGTAGGTVFYNDGAADHLDRVWARMGAEQQVLVVAKVGKKGLPNTPGLEINIAKRHGSLYVDDWNASPGTSGTTSGIGISGHAHDYETRNVRVSEYAGTPAGSDNVVVGNAAGSSLGSTSAENVIIGSSAGASAANDTESVVVGYNAGNYAAAAPGISSYDAAGDITVIGEDIVTQQPIGETTAQRNALLTSDRIVTVYGATGGTANEKGYARIIDTDTPTVYSAAKFTDFDNDFHQANVIQLTVNDFLIAFEEYDDVTDNAFELWLIVGQESSGTISYGTAVQVDNYTPGGDFHLDKISANYAVLTLGDTGGTYTDSIIITISGGTTITVGTSYAYTTDDVASANSYVLSTTRIVTVWNAISGSDRTIKSRVANVAGTTITYASTTHTVAADSGDTPQYLRGGTLSSTHFILSFIRTDSGADGQLIVGSVAGDDTISFGSEVEFYSAVFDVQSLAVFGATKAVVTYMDSGAWGFRSKIITISGTTPTLGASATFTPDDDDERPHVLAVDASTFLVSYDTDDGPDTYIRYTLGNLTDVTRAANTFVGAGAGGGDDLSYNVAIGHDAGANETASYRLYIDISNTATPLIYGEFDDDNLGINATDMASGEGVIAIANASVVPSGTPTGGGVLYVEGGALKYKGSSGTITTLGVA